MGVMGFIMDIIWLFVMFIALVLAVVAAVVCKMCYKVTSTDETLVITGGLGK